MLERNGLTVSEVDACAVHPGGPKILSTVAEKLALPDGAFDASFGVLAQVGNCSSATLLLVLDALRSQDRPRPGRVAVAMAFGPGLTLYAVLRELQTLFAVWTGACHTCHQPVDWLQRTPQDTT